MRNRRFTQWIAIVAALAVTGLVAADDRDFLQEVAAAPNLIFILDTSSSMVGSPEVPGFVIPGCDPNVLRIDTSDPPDGVPDVADPGFCYNGARVNAAMLPGGGDDPYSRLGIAKRVLKEFLVDVGEANVALAGYAQANPDPPGDTPDLSGVNLGGVPTKHWVYEARAQDRFHMVEATYAYRFGSSWSHDFQNLDVPADVYKQALIGYKPYFDPDTSDVYDRYGPINAQETGYTDVLPDSSVVPVPYDLMPIYFDNCFVDNKETPAVLTDDVTICADGVFPFYDSGVRDTVTGVLVPSTWYYGQFGENEEDYPGCDPNDPIWDDGFGSPVDGACENEWEETSGANLIQYQRRVRLEIPATVAGNPNYFLSVDVSDNPVGNDHVADGTAEDYDLDGFSDDDLDGDNTNDWMLYVNSVEERNSRTCAPAASLPTWTPTLTPTPTFTLTPTLTPTPTPIVDCARITVTDLIAYSSYDWKATFTNGLSSEIVIQQMDFIWIPKDSTHYVDYISFRYMNSYSSSYLLYTGNDYTSPTSVTIPWATNSTLEAAADLAANSSAPWYLNMSSDTRQDGYHQLCVDFIVYNLPTSGANWLCADICAEDWGSLNTPTPTPTETNTPYPTAPPTNTRTNTPLGGPTNTPTSGASTPTNTPTSFVIQTSTPTPFPTNTPVPPTATRTATKTATPTT